jgi:hypothetical protein
MIEVRNLWIADFLSYFNFFNSLQPQSVKVRFRSKANGL